MSSLELNELNKLEGETIKAEDAVKVTEESELKNGEVPNVSTIVTPTFIVETEKSKENQEEIVPAVVETTLEGQSEDKGPITEMDQVPSDAETNQIQEAANAVIVQSIGVEEDTTPPPALQSNQRDEDVAAEASTSSNHDGDGLTELQRLRNLVFASRGSKASLPAGWDDDAVEPQAASIQQSIPEAKLIPESSDGAAQKMLQRAISMVGQLASDSDSGSDDSTDSDSDSSSSTSSSTTASANKKGRRRPIVQEADLSDDEEGGGGVGGGQGPTTKNEVLEPTVDPPPYNIVPMEKELRPLGKVHSIVDCVVVVAQDVGKAPGQQQQQRQPQLAYQAPFDMHGRKGEEEGEYSVLDTGSLLAFPDRSVLGVVFETFGSVLSPLYALRYPSASHVNQDLIKVGKEVSYVPSHSTYVLTRALRALGKGSDASNLWDEEIGDDEREFSDDEAEAAHKRNAKVNKGKGKKRSHPEEGGKSSSGGGGGGGGQSRPVKHSLPMRPTAAPLHRDAEGGANQSFTLSYDDEETTGHSKGHSTSAAYQPQLHAATPDPYALWALQQQQQRQPPMLPPLHFTSHLQSRPSNAQPVHPTSSYYPNPSINATADSYDPQQPLFGLARPPLPSWPPNPPQ